MDENEFCGEGAFGRVEKPPVNYDGKKYVVKKMSLNRLKLYDQKLTLSTILKELRILAKLDHKYIVRYNLFGFEGPNKEKYEKDENTPIEIGFPTSDGKFSGAEDFFFIRMEYCESDIEKLLLEKQSQEERNKFRRQFYTILGQIMKAFEYFHKERVIHRDIKPPNILLKKKNQGETEEDWNWMVKVCDFGLACEEIDDCEANTKSCRGTELYQAPEMRSRNYNTKVDIYSAGLTFLEMLYYFKDRREREITFGSIYVWKDDNDYFDTDNKLGLDCLDIQLIKEMTKKNVEKRADASKILGMIKRTASPCESTSSDGNDWVKLQGKLSIESSDAEATISMRSSVADCLKATVVDHPIVEQHRPNLIFLDILEHSNKFSGRNDERRKLRKMFNPICKSQQDSGPYKKIHKLVLISGLSGVGKSELVRKFVKELKTEAVANCVWLKGETQVTLKESILKLANLLHVNLKELDSSKPKTIIAILTEIIERTTSDDCPWVFVIDNLDKKEELEKLALQVIEKLQNAQNNLVIVTSQLPGALGGDGYHMELDVWTDTEAHEFVKDQLENSGSQEDIQSLCKTLQNLPLVLNLAVNSIEKKRRTGTKGSKYSVRDYQDEMLSEKYDKELPEDLVSLSKAWKVIQVIHGDIIRESPLGSVAIDVLGCLSYLDPDGIHIATLTKLICSATIHSKNEQESYWMPQVYNRACNYFKSFLFVEPGGALWSNANLSSKTDLHEYYSLIIPKCLIILRSFSLIRMENDVVTVHRLVQKIIRLVNPLGKSPLAHPPSYSPLSNLVCGAEVVLKEAHFNKDTLRQINLLWNHIKTVDTLLIKFKFIPPSISQWMQHLGLVSENLEFLIETNSRITSNLLQEDDKALLLFKWALGVGYELAEKVEEANEIFEKLIPTMERVFGETDEKTIQASMSCAAILRCQKRDDEAFMLYESLLKKAQAIASETQLDDTELTIKIKQKLAHLYGKRGELEKELESLQDILKWKESNQNGCDGKMKDTISLLRTRQNVGCCYMRLKMYKEAKETFQFVYENRLELLKEDHPSTLNTKHDLAEAILNLGENNEIGLRYLEEVLHLKIKVQGENHRRTKLTHDAIDHWSKVLKEAVETNN